MPKYLVVPLFDHNVVHNSVDTAIEEAITLCDSQGKLAGGFAVIEFTEIGRAEYMSPLWTRNDEPMAKPNVPYVPPSDEIPF